MTCGVAARLIALHEYGDGKLLNSHIVEIDRQELIAAVYRSFRTYVEGPDYDPRHWEPGDQEDDSLAPDWDGEPLRALKSEVIETYLRTPGGKGPQPSEPPSAR